MLLNGIQPPPVGSVKDVILTRMYQMDQMQRHFDVHTFGMLMVSSATASIPQNGAQQIALNNVKKILSHHAESVAYGNWSSSKVKKIQEEKVSDEEMLRRVALMGRMKLGK